MRIGNSYRATSYRSRAFTLIEVVMAAALIALIYGGVINAYILADRRAEWSGYSLAAQAISVRQLETARSARWELWDVNYSTAFIDQITNSFPAFTNRSTLAMDIPISGNTNKWLATNYFNITPIASYYNMVGLKKLSSVVVWQLQSKLFTNSVMTYIAPDE